MDGHEPSSFTDQPGLSFKSFSFVLNPKMENLFEQLPNQDQERDLRRILFALAWASYPEKRTQSLLRK